MAVKYKRVLLKISGEQLAGDQEIGIDPKFVAWLADEIKQVVETGVQLVIVVGGGNMVRGQEMAGRGITRVTADQMGMLSGLMNAMATTDIFETKGIKTRCLSNVFADQVAESYSYRRANKHLEQGRVVLVAGGMGRPYFTHDTAAVNIALELDCEVMLKATKVDGVYNKDPKQFDDAKHLPKLSYQQAIEDANVKVMDKAALGLALEQGMPIVVFDLETPGNILKVMQGESIGTKVS